MQQEIKIAEDRIGALIGKGGLTKKKVEEETGTVISVESREGITRIEGEDAEGVLRAVGVVNAIGRGFSPDRAFTLLEDEDLILDIMDISGEADGPRQLDRLRGRIIGKDGKSREQIENMTKTSLSVYGKTVAVIGLPEQIKLARTAIDMLIKGVPHESVFSFLEKKKREAKHDMLSYYY